MLSELCALCERKTFTKYVSSPIGVTSHITPLAIRRGAGGEASVNSVCRRRSVGSKLCAKMLSELCALCERKTFTKYVSSPIGVTSHTNNQLAPPPSPPPKGRGVITEIPM